MDDEFRLDEIIECLDDYYFYDLKIIEWGDNQYMHHINE